MSIKATIELDPRVRLKARRSLDGNIMIFDHEDLDIVFLPEKNKCLTFPKESMSDKVYEAQDRMFRFLAKKGVINNSSIRGGNVFGSMEADILESKLPGVDATQVFLFVIHEYINQEKPYFKSSEEYDDERLDALLRPYGFQYNYSLVRESESED